MSIFALAPPVSVNRGLATQYKSVLPQQIAMVSDAMARKTAKAKIGAEGRNDWYDWISDATDKYSDKTFTTDQHKLMTDGLNNLLEEGTALNSQNINPRSNVGFMTNANNLMRSKNRMLSSNAELSNLVERTKDDGDMNHLRMDILGPELYKFSAERGMDIDTGDYLRYANEAKHAWDGYTLAEKEIGSWGLKSEDEAALIGMNGEDYAAVKRRKYPPIYGAEVTDGKQLPLNVSNEFKASIKGTNYDKWLKWNEKENGIPYDDQLQLDAMKYGGMTEEIESFRQVSKKEPTEGDKKKQRTYDWVGNMYEGLTSGDPQRINQELASVSLPSKGITFSYNANNEIIPHVTKTFLNNDDLVTAALNATNGQLNAEDLKKSLEKGEVDLPPLDDESLLQLVSTIARYRTDLDQIAVDEMVRKLRERDGDAPFNKSVNIMQGVGTGGSSSGSQTPVVPTLD